MRVYISGPMTGHAGFNYAAFARAAKLLRANGHKVVSPAETDGAERTWAEWMKKHIPSALTCDALFMLDGWDKSQGAILEKHIADSLGMDVYFQVDKERNLCQKMTPP